jgi:hypothetical protein
LAFRIVDADRMGSCFWFRPWALAGLRDPVAGMGGRVGVLDGDGVRARTKEVEVGDSAASANLAVDLSAASSWASTSMGLSKETKHWVLASK